MVYYKVVDVEAKPEYVLHLEFNNGEKRIFDMKPYLDEGVFQRIKDPAMFAAVKALFGTAVWPGSVDIAPEMLYSKSLPI